MSYDPDDDDKVYIKAKGYSDDSGAKIDCYSKDPREGEHDTIHFNIDTNTGKWSANSKIDDKKENAEGNCYLTTACMRHFGKGFDDNCHELTVLRMFRDNFVPPQEIAHYYTTAPIIVSAINKVPNNDAIYKYIYNTIVNPCVEAIKNGDFSFAYDRYKNTTLVLEETFAKKELQGRLVRTLKRAK